MPRAIVLIGPIMPICELSPEPMRSMAIITISTGATVQAVPLISDSQSTAGATWADASGSCRWSSRNWAMQSAQATVEARPVRRSAPSRPTTSPLATR